MTTDPNAANPLAAYPAFAAAVRSRLDAGRSAYADQSFSRSTVELVAELQQEALDLAGWGFILWRRLEAMRAALEQHEHDGARTPIPRRHSRQKAPKGTNPQ